MPDLIEHKYDYLKKRYLLAFLSAITENLIVAEDKTWKITDKGLKEFD